MFTGITVMSVVEGLAIGLLCGMVPFILGKKRGLRVWSEVAVGCSVLGGLLFGMIAAAPVAALFTIVIMIKKKLPAKAEITETVS